MVCKHFFSIYFFVSNFSSPFFILFTFSINCSLHSTTLFIVDRMMQFTYWFLRWNIVSSVLDDCWSIPWSFKWFICNYNYNIILLTCEYTWVTSQKYVEILRDGVSTDNNRAVLVILLQKSLQKRNKYRWHKKTCNCYKNITISYKIRFEYN